MHEDSSEFSVLKTLDYLVCASSPNNAQMSVSLCLVLNVDSCMCLRGAVLVGKPVVGAMDV